MSRLRFTGWKQLVQSHRARECQMQNESSDFQTPGRHIASVSGQWSFLSWAWMNINLHATDIYWMSHVQYWECNRPTKQSCWGCSPWESLLALRTLLTDTACYLLHCVFTFFLLWDRSPAAFPSLCVQEAGSWCGNHRPQQQSRECPEVRSLPRRYWQLGTTPRNQGVLREPLRVCPQEFSRPPMSHPSV